MVLESPIVIQRLVGGSKDSDSLHNHRLVLEVGTDLLELLYFLNAVHLFMRVALGLMLQIVVGMIKDEIMVTADNNLVLVGQLLYKLTKADHLSPVGVLREVSSVDEDVSFRHAAYIQPLMTVVGIRHGDNSDHLQDNPNFACDKLMNWKCI